MTYENHILLGDLDFAIVTAVGSTPDARLRDARLRLVHQGSELELDDETLAFLLFLHDLDVPLEDCVEVEGNTVRLREMTP